MSIKVAVASTDGKYINQHFGKADKFLIFEINGPGDYEFFELRETSPSCGSYRDECDNSVDTSSLLSDCKAVIASQIGPGASQKLINKGIIPFMNPAFIEEALEQISKNLDKLDNLLH